MWIRPNRFRWSQGLPLLLLSLAACKSSGGGGSAMLPGQTPDPPTVLSATPAGGGTGIPLNEVASATFSEAMDIATLNGSTFLLTVGPSAIPVRGEIVYANARAVFWPRAHLPGNSICTVTITTGARSAAGVALAANHSWTFRTGSADTTAQFLPSASGGVPQQITPVDTRALARYLASAYRDQGDAAIK